MWAQTFAVTQLSMNQEKMITDNVVVSSVLDSRDAGKCDLSLYLMTSLKDTGTVAHRHDCQTIILLAPVLYQVMWVEVKLATSLC
jgi:hypothetical protein